MSCYQRELPDEVVFIYPEGKSPQLVYDLITKGIQKLKAKGMETLVDQSNALGEIPIKTKTSEETWIESGTWIVKGYEKSNDDYWFDRKECFSCGSTNLKIETSKDGTRTLRCKSCGVPNACIEEKKK